MVSAGCVVTLVRAVCFPWWSALMFCTCDKKDQVVPVFPPYTMGGSRTSSMFIEGGTFLLFICFLFYRRMCQAFYLHAY